MNKWILLSFSVLLFATVGQGLVCKVCNYKWGKFCWDAKEPCQAEKGQYCETTHISAFEIPLFSTYGCGKFSELCNKTETRNTAMQTSFKRYCCDSDLCNG